VTRYEVGSGAPGARFARAASDPPDVTERNRSRLAHPLRSVTSDAESPPPVSDRAARLARYSQWSHLDLLAELIRRLPPGNHGGDRYVFWLATMSRDGLLELLASQETSADHDKRRA